MNKPIFRNIILYSLLAGFFIVVDLLIDRLVQDSEPIIPHLLFVALAVMVSYLLLSRGLRMRRQAEEILRQAQAELESRVQQRTQELEHANQALQREIEERQLATEALRASELKFSTVFHLSPDAIGIVRQSDSAILEVNDAFLKMWGGTRADVIGKTWMDLNLIADEEEGRRVIELLLERRKIEDYELNFTGLDGKVATMLVSLIPITINEESCILAIAHDITERKQSELALARIQAELARGIQERSAQEERQRLARELHDSVSQALYGISLGAHTALTLLQGEQARVLEALNYVLSLAQAGLAEMRALIFELRPDSLELEGLVTALTKHIAALRARYGIRVEMRSCSEPDVPIQIKEALYRIAMEAMHNAVKHARTEQLEITLACTGESMELCICDTGIGFDSSAAFPGHLGLHFMRERALDLGGRFEVTSSPGCGTQIQVWVPLIAIPSS